MLKFVHISDTHLPHDRSLSPDWGPYPPYKGAEALIKAINNLPLIPDFILHTGDVAYDPHENIYKDIKQLMDQLKAPVIYLAGNHDDPEQMQRELFNLETVQPELYYQRSINGVQLVCLDSNCLENPEHHTGLVSDEQLAWLDDICSQEDDRPLLVAIHHNPINMGVPWLDDTMVLENGEDFHEILLKAKARLAGVFFGHIHQNIDVYRDGILYTSAASSWVQFESFPIPENQEVSTDFSALPGFSVVNITRERTFIRRHTYVVDTTSSQNA